MITDEPADGQTPASVLADAGVDPELSIASPLGAMGVGVHVGTFAHRVLELTDFAAKDLERELELRMAEVQGRRAVEIGASDAVLAGLRAVIETPLGGTLGPLRLRDIRRADRLDELGFELPLAGGDRPAGLLSLSAFAGVLREHLATEDPLAGYAQRLEDPRLRQLVRGYLTGSLDLVVRVPGPTGPRYAVIDYKTNWLGALDHPLTTFMYRPAAIAAEMQRHHYALQALLYTVALHRYLRWRLPGYDSAQHLAGAVYLFLRGMIGLDTPVLGGSRCGVFSWEPPGGLVEALSDALDADGDR